MSGGNDPNGTGANEPSNEPSNGAANGAPGDAAAGARLAGVLDEISARALPPVHAWHPDESAEIDIRIARDGAWWHEGRRIERERMVRLFSTVLRAEGGRTWLVTPQVKLAITVDDAPFTAVAMELHGAPEAPALAFTTNLGDRVVADAEHPITVRYDEPGGEPSPYVEVRDGLLALISRPVFMELAGLAEERDGELGVVSRGTFMVLGPAEDPDEGPDGGGGGDPSEGPGAA